MKMYWVWVLAISLLLLMPLTGCNMTSEQRIDVLEAAVTQAETSAGQIDEHIAAVESAITEATTMLTEGTIPDDQKETVLKYLKDMQEALVTAKLKKAEIAAAITEWKDKITTIKEQGSGIGVELQMIGEGLNSISTAVPGQYGGYVGLAGLVITALGSFIGGKKIEKVGSTKTISGLVQSVNSMLNTQGETTKSEMVAALKSKQEELGVREAVRSVLKQVT